MLRNAELHKRWMESQQASFFSDNNSKHTARVVCIPEKKENYTANRNTINQRLTSRDPQH